MAVEVNMHSEDTTPVPSRMDAMEVLDEKSKTEPPNKEHVYVGDTLSFPRQILFVGTVCMAMFTNQLGLGQTLDIVQIIGESYGITNPGDLSWLVAGYSLSIGTFILIAGRFGDEFGHKKMFVIGMAWNALWSLVAGFAVYSDKVLFIFARVFQGMGPAMTLPNALAILGSSYSAGPKRNMAFALFGGTAPFGAIGGFATGGLFALAWWPWTYWSTAIALTCLSIFSAWVIPSQMVDEAARHRTWRESINHLDLPGGFTGVTALILFNFAWNQSYDVGWQQPYVYVCLILGVLFGIAFFLIELHWSDAPILPVAAFNVDVAFVFGCTATGWAVFGIWVFYAAEIVTQLGGISPILLAAWYSPVVPSGLISALVVGKLLGKISAAWVMVVGQVAYLVGSILITTMPVGQVYWGQFFFSVLIICVGMDSSFPAATIIFSNAVPPKYQGIGASLVLTIVNYSISLGLGFAGTVERSVNNGGVTDADKLKGYQGAFYMEVGLAGLGLLLSLVFLAKGYFADRSKKPITSEESAEGSM